MRRVLLMILAFSACTLSPEYHRDVERLNIANRFYATSNQSDSDFSDRFQSVLQDSVLEEWIQKLTADNTTLLAASHRVKASESLVAQDTGALFPTLSLEGTGNRSRQNLNSFGGLGEAISGIDQSRTRSIYNEIYTLQLVSSWQIDVFGALRKQRRATLANYQASVFELEALKRSFIAELVKLRVAFYSRAKELEVLQKIVKSRKADLAAIKSRYESGASDTSSLAVQIAKEALSTAQADLAGLKKEQLSLLFALDVLLGQAPTIANAEDVDARLNAYGATIEFPKQENWSIAAPAYLLDNRPDLLASEFRVLAANEQVAVSIANLYPDLRLSAALGYQSNATNQLIQPEQLVWQIAGTLGQKLFAGGALRANVAQREAEFEALQADYLTAILQALQEAQTALMQAEYLDREYRLRRKSLRALKQAKQSSWRQYLLGLIEAQDYYTTERQHAALQRAVIVLQETYRNALVNLHVALGGEWKVRKK